MKKLLKSKRIKALLLVAVALLAMAAYAMAASIPSRAVTKGGVNVAKNAKVTIDYSNLSEGFVSVQYTGGKDVRIKVQVARAGGITYTYDLNSDGTAEIFPLTDGNGKYTVKVFENVSGTKYSQAYSTELNVSLRDDLLPYLYPNQYVNYTSDSAVVKKAAELVSGASTELDKLTAIYDYVVSNFTYDYDKANNVQSGYIPNVDSVFEQKTGICFDYAAVMAAMLRSQDIPCKLVIGYATTTYHAWVSVYIPGQGWIDNAIYFDGQKWSLMDPTFASTGNSSPSAMEYITNETNYTQKFAY